MKRSIRNSRPNCVQKDSVKKDSAASANDAGSSLPVSQEKPQSFALVDTEGRVLADNIPSRYAAKQRAARSYPGALILPSDRVLPPDQVLRSLRDRAQAGAPDGVNDQDRQKPSLAA